MKSLKGRMPRLFPDNRRPEAKRFREVYEDIEGKYTLEDGISRRIAALTAKAWLDFEQISRELAPLTKKILPRTSKRALSVNRLRRRQASLVGMFLGGLRTLDSISGKPVGADLAKAMEMALKAEEGQ